MGIRTPFDIMGTTGNYRFFPFIFTINTKLNPDNTQDNTFIIPFREGSYPTLVGKPVGINWGDGVYTIIEDGIFTQEKCTHTYENAGTYNISIISAGDNAPFFSFYDYYSDVNNNSLKVIATSTGIIPPIEEDGSEITSVQYIFAGCVNLREVTSKLFDNLPNLTDYAFAHTFDGCINLTNLPQYLFRKNTLVASHAFDHTFKDCVNLTSLPGLLFRYASTASDYAFYGTFEGCNGLTVLPANTFLYATGTTNNAFEQTFLNCVNLKTIEDGALASCTSYSYKEMFKGCTSLQINPYIFGNYISEPGIKTTKFNTSGIQYNFTSMFERDTFFSQGTAGEAPDLWAWTFAETPISENCFKGLGNFTLTNYRSIPTSWGGPEQYTFTINPTPTTASILLTADGYTQVGNSITVHSGTVVTWTVSAPNFISQSDTYTVTANATLNINLNPVLYHLSISPAPADAQVILTATGYVQEGNGITVPYGTEVAWSVSHAHYITQSDTITVTGEQILPIELEKETYSITINPTPADATVTINAVERTYAEFPYNTIVSWEVSKYGYITQYNQFAIEENVSLDINLDEKTVTITVEVTPEEATVIINGEERTSISVKEGTEVTWYASCPGYIDATETIIAEEDDTITVDLDKAYSLTFATHPDNASMSITYDEETYTEKSITVAANYEVSWQASAIGYTSKSSTFITGEYDLTAPITLEPDLYTFTINTTPADATVKFLLGHDLPDTYEELEYVQNRNDYCVDIDYIPKPNTRIKANIMFTYSLVGALFGTADTSENVIFGSTTKSRKIYYTFGDVDGVENIIEVPDLDTSLYTNYQIEYNQNSVYFDGKTAFGQNSTFTCSYPMYLFAIDAGPDTIMDPVSGMRIYSFEVYEDDILIHNYVPSRNIASQKVGFYDVIDGRFFTEVADRELIAGPVVNNHSIDCTKDTVINWTVSHHGFTPQSGTVTLLDDTTISVTLSEIGHVDIEDYTYIENDSGVMITKYIGSGTDIVAPHLEVGSS